MKENKINNGNKDENCICQRLRTRINVQFGFALTEEQSEKIYNFIDENISEDWVGFQQDITEE